MNKLVVEIEDSDLYKDFNIYCAENSMTKKETITRLLRRFLEGSENERRQMVGRKTI